MRISTLKKLKPGDKIKVNQSYKDFWSVEAFRVCTKPGGMQTEEEAKDYFIRKAIAMGLPYEATFLAYRESAGEGPGASVRLKVGDLEDTCIMDAKDMGIR